MSTKIRIKFDNSQPIEASNLAETFYNLSKGLDNYLGYSRRNKLQVKLFVQEIEKGSQVYDVVVAGCQLALPLYNIITSLDAQTTIEFGKALIDNWTNLSNREPPANISNRTMKNIAGAAVALNGDNYGKIEVNIINGTDLISERKFTPEDVKNIVDYYNKAGKEEEIKQIKNIQIRLFQIREDVRNLKCIFPDIYNRPVKLEIPVSLQEKFANMVHGSNNPLFIDITISGTLSLRDGVPQTLLVDDLIQIGAPVDSQTQEDTFKKLGLF